jgi:DMSO/TMAO reductase YedYZ molybdopterin-dependent catalytic subunit
MASASDRFERVTRPAIAGAASAAAALATGELVAGILSGAPSLVAAVGSLVIDLQPPGAKDFVVGLFGTNDKLALEIAIVVVALAIAAGLGIAARRRFAIGAGGFAAFALLGFVAAIRDPQAMPALAAATAAASAAVGIQFFSWLIGPAATVDGRRNVEDARGGDAPARADRQPRRRRPSMPNWSRRTFLLRSAAVAAGSVAAATVGRTLLAAQRAAPSTAGHPVPPPAVTASLPGGAELSVGGITPLVVPNGTFYRIDTALLVPNVDIAAWKVRVWGMVDREVTLTFDQLVQLPIFEQYVTIACVSNYVGGDLVGNAKWTGVHLRDVLAMAGVQNGATQIVGRSVDGFTVGMPTEWVMDTRRDPMIAVEMNGAPLPREHGFPARLIVPGLYGYVSATKWLAELQLTTLEAFDAYWVPLGWAKKAPILTQSRIDVPHSGSAIPAGRVSVAGVAWAPDRGVNRVEVAIDGAWQEATISTPISKTTWVQWLYAWNATPGKHSIEVRATDATGEVQTADQSEPAPDGARGHHTISVTVT